MLKTYYKHRLSSLLSETLVNTILSGELVRAETLLADNRFKKMDNQSVQMLHQFLLFQQKTLSNDSKNEKIVFTSASELMMSNPEFESDVVAEAIASLEKAVDQIVNNYIVPYNTEELLLGGFQRYVEPIINSIKAEDLYHFFKDYDKDKLKEFIATARMNKDETEYGLKLKMVVSKMRKNIKSQNIKIEPAIELSHNKPNSLDDVDALIEKQLGN